MHNGYNNIDNNNTKHIYIIKSSKITRKQGLRKYFVFSI